MVKKRAPRRRNAAAEEPPQEGQTAQPPRRRRNAASSASTRAPVAPTEEQLQQQQQFEEQKKRLQEEEDRRRRELDREPSVPPGLYDQEPATHEETAGESLEPSTTPRPFERAVPMRPSLSASSHTSSAAKDRLAFVRKPLPSAPPSASAHQQATTSRRASASGGGNKKPSPSPSVHPSPVLSMAELIAPAKTTPRAMPPIREDESPSQAPSPASTLRAGKGTAGTRKGGDAKTPKTPAATPGPLEDENHGAAPEVLSPASSSTLEATAAYTAALAAQQAQVDANVSAARLSTADWVAAQKELERAEQEAEEELQQLQGARRNAPLAPMTQAEEKEEEEEEGEEEEEVKAEEEEEEEVQAEEDSQMKSEGEEEEEQQAEDEEKDEDEDEEMKYEEAEAHPGEGMQLEEMQGVQMADGDLDLLNFANYANWMDFAMEDVTATGFNMPNENATTSLTMANPAMINTAMSAAMNSAAQQATTSTNTHHATMTRNTALSVASRPMQPVFGRLDPVAHWQHNRSFHGYHHGTYTFPNDLIEQSRLELQHAIWLTLLSNRLFLAPLLEPTTVTIARPVLGAGTTTITIPRDAPVHVLDIGAGTGRWAVEFARAHPNAFVLGTDLSLIQPGKNDPGMPKNCFFFLDDFEADDRWVFDHDFDYVHLRMMFSCFAKPERVYQSIYDNLKPGGWVEFQDMAFELGCLDDSSQGSALEKWVAMMQEAGTCLGRDFRKTSKYRDWLGDLGFVDVNWRTLNCPGGPWPTPPPTGNAATTFNNDGRDAIIDEDPALPRRPARNSRELGYWMRQNMLQFVEGASLGTLTRGLGTSPAQAMMLAEAAKRDLRDPRMKIYWTFYVVWARKPFIGEMRR